MEPEFKPCKLSDVPDRNSKNIGETSKSIIQDFIDSDDEARVATIIGYDLDLTYARLRTANYNMGNPIKISRRGDDLYLIKES